MASKPMDHRIVLIVEDDDDAREILARTLDLHGFLAMQARNGRDALDQIEEGAFLPALILLDLDMPVMGGLELLQRLAERADEAGPKVIVISGNVPRSIAGAMAVLQKPLEMSKLLTLMLRLLRPSEADGLKS